MYCHLTLWKYCWSWVTWKRVSNNDAEDLFASIHQLITRNKDMEWGILVVTDFLLAPKLS